jgi:hypothetical protein
LRSLLISEGTRGFFGYSDFNSAWVVDSGAALLSTAHVQSSFLKGITSTIEAFRLSETLWAFPGTTEAK